MTDPCPFVDLNQSDLYYDEANKGPSLSLLSVKGF